MKKILGEIFKVLGIKNEVIKLYEKLYDKTLSLQMYILKPFDTYWEKKNHINMMSIEETIEYIIENKCSISRFGDGEFNIVSGNTIGFQEKSEKLKKGMIDILNNPEKYSTCLVALPGIFRNENDYEKYTKKFWNKILVRKRKLWYSLCNKEYRYGNADITRCYIELQDRSKSKFYFERMKKIWENREVVIIEGEKSRLGVGNDLFSNCQSIKRILCPSKNAFEAYEKIVKYTEKMIEKDVLLLIALGPTATVMAAELSIRGYQVIDIGNIDKEYEWCLSNATQKVVNPIKFTMEIPVGVDVLECRDQEYLESIINKISL